MLGLELSTSLLFSMGLCLDTGGERQGKSKRGGRFCWC